MGHAPAASDGGKVANIPLASGDVGRRATAL